MVTFTQNATQRLIWLKYLRTGRSSFKLPSLFFFLNDSSVMTIKNLHTYFHITLLCFHYNCSHADFTYAIIIMTNYLMYRKTLLWYKNHVHYQHLVLKEVLNRTAFYEPSSTKRYAKIILLHVSLPNKKNPQKNRSKWEFFYFDKPQNLPWCTRMKSYHIQCILWQILKRQNA